MIMWSSLVPSTDCSSKSECRNMCVRECHIAVRGVCESFATLTPLWDILYS